MHSCIQYWDNNLSKFYIHVYIYIQRTRFQNYLICKIRYSYIAMLSYNYISQCGFLACKFRKPHHTGFIVLIAYLVPFPSAISMTNAKNTINYILLLNLQMFLWQVIVVCLLYLQLFSRRRGQSSNIGLVILLHAQRSLALHTPPQRLSTSSWQR